MSFGLSRVIVRDYSLFMFWLSRFNADNLIGLSIVRADFNQDARIPQNIRFYGARSSNFSSNIFPILLEIPLQISPQRCIEKTALGVCMECLTWEKDVSKIL